MTPSTFSRFRWLNTASWLWLVAGLGLGGYLIASGSTADTELRSAPDQLASVAAHAPAPHATRKIEDIRVGMRVLGENPDAREVDPELPDPDAETWRQVSLEMKKENGDQLRIVLLRPVEWLSFFEVAVGRTIDLDLSEMGAEGPADVLAVEPCPPLPPDPGNVVTGTFAHRSSGDLVDLQLAGEPRPIGVTRNHRYWSEDRQAFVAAGDLRRGERLLTATGETTTLVSRNARPTDEPVYNLEVHQHHVYRVGQLGVLVHNNYTEFAYRSLNPDDIANIQNGNGVIRTGRKGNQAFADVISSNAQDTNFIPATELFDVIQRYGDPDNYIKFRPADLQPGTYRSMKEILRDSDIMSRLDANGRRWLMQQAHSMAIGKIPMEAIEEIVIMGVKVSL